MPFCGVYFFVFHYNHLYDVRALTLAPICPVGFPDISWDSYLGQSLIRGMVMEAPEERPTFSELVDAILGQSG